LVGRKGCGASAMRVTKKVHFDIVAADPAKTSRASIIPLLLGRKEGRMWGKKTAKQGDQERLAEGPLREEKSSKRRWQKDCGSKTIHRTVGLQVRRQRS